jgi:D-tyrosyl-tRNA(Tyr) deacylase
MRAVVQRVRSASVSVDGRIAGAIGSGLLVFVGVAHSDGPDDVRYIATKLHDLRIFPDDAGRMNRSVVETGGSVLVVSQFTLHADCRKGRRPSFDAAAPAALAEALYLDVVRMLRDRGLTVETGVFQADMSVALVNDGPVTMLLDSAKAF